MEFEEWKMGRNGVSSTPRQWGVNYADGNLFPIGRRN